MKMCLLSAFFLYTGLSAFETFPNYACDLVLGHLLRSAVFLCRERQTTKEEKNLELTCKISRQGFTNVLWYSRNFLLREAIISIMA